MLGGSAFLLISHVLMTAVASELVSGYEPSYGLLLAMYWSIAPAYAFLQLFAPPGVI